MIRDLQYPLHRVKALGFDVFGTVVDWRSGVARESARFLLRQGLHVDPLVFADDWRSRYQPAMQSCRNGQRPFVRLDQLHREILEDTLIQFGLDVKQVDPAELHALSLAWHRLDPWPDVLAGLTRLKRQRVIFPMSNGNVALLLNMAKSAALPWDLILGGEVTRAYKPQPEAYLRNAELLGIEPEELCLVAAHNDDLAAAQHCGLKTAFVCRPQEHGPQQQIDLQAEGSWDLMAQDFMDLADQLGS